MRVEAVVRNHWEKFIAALVLGACAWAAAETARLFGSSSNPLGIEESIGAVRGALAKRAPTAENYEYASDPPDYSKGVRASLVCDGYAATIRPVPPHLMHPLAPKPARRKKQPPLEPTFGPPVFTDFILGQGKVEVVVAQNPKDEHVKVLRFELFRREEGEEYGGKPLALLDAETVSEGAARASFLDGQVGPKKRYTYKVRAVGMVEPQSPEEEREILRPQGAEEILVDGKVAWVTPFSTKAVTRTHADVELELLGIVGEPPDLAASIRIRRWDRETDVWYKSTFIIREGEPIRGERIVKLSLGQQKIRLDSGYILVKIERVKERVRGEATSAEIEVPQITVREVSTGEMKIIRAKPRR